MALAAHCSPEGSRTNSFSRSISHLQSDQRSSSWLPEPSNASTGPLLYVNFNQDYGCFACGTENGFRIYNCDPFKETFRREFDEEGGLASSSSPKRTELDGNGIGIVEMLFRSNISALVGGGKSPRYLPNKVMVWDDNQSRCIGELLFRSEVRAVKLRRDRIVVVLEHKVYVYNFSDLKLLHQIETFANRKGICVVCPASSMFVLACPGLRGGEVRLELYSSKKTRFVQAHDSPLACLALSQDGSLLATASTKGTLVRIFNTNDGTKLQELRRGADRATIFSLAFSVNCQWLVLSSDKCTVHVFSLRSPIPSSNSMTASSLLSFRSSNTGSSLSFVKGVLPRYFSSEWSFAQFRLPENTKAIVAFGPQKNTVIIVCSNGSYYRCTYDPDLGGDMIEKEFARFVNTEESK